MRSFDQFRLDVVNQRLWRGDTEIPLMPKPFAVLRYLVEHPGILVTHDELLNAIWPDTFVQPEVLRRYVLEIRRALDDRAESPRFVRTVPKRGYEFIAAVRSDAVDLRPEAATPLVGRSNALADLDRCLARALGGQRQIVFIVGEPGIGKTSVVDEFVVRSKVLSARGQCVEGFGGKEAYFPILEIVGQLARSPSRSTVIGALSTGAPTWLAQLPGLVPPAQPATPERELPAVTSARMVREICEAFERICDSVPLLLILEDLHWVDASTVDVLSAIARRREPARLLVVGTYRPADLILYESPLRALRRDLLLHRLGQELELDRLEPKDVADYLVARFGPGDLAAALAPVIHQHSDGNPLFMTAMLDHLVQRQVLAERGGRWTMGVPLAEVDPGTPDTLKELLQAQLQQLSAFDQHALRCASVSGQQFTAWSVTVMTGAQAAEVEAACEGLVERQQFLHPAGARELPDGTLTMTYRFRHALYRDVLYRRLPSGLRVELHRRFAEALERLRSPVDPDMATELALHFEMARELERAVRYHLLAADNATRRYAHEQAIHVLHHARQLLSRIPPPAVTSLHLQLLERLGNAHFARGDMDQSSRAYEAMAEVAAVAGRLRDQADALVAGGHRAESIPFFLRAVALDPEFAGAYTTLSRIYSNLGESDRAREFAARAYAGRDALSDRDRLSVTYQYHYEVTGNQTQATETLEEWKRRFPEEFQPVNSLAVIHNFLGDFERAVVEGREAVALNPSHGYPYSNLALAYRGLGRFDEARRAADNAVALAVETLPTRCLLYQLAVMAGDAREAARHVEWARDQPREFEMVATEAQAAAWSGRMRQARMKWDEARDLAERRNLPEVACSLMAAAAATEVVYGNSERAGTLARQVLNRAPSSETRLRAAFVLGLAGWRDEATAVADEAAATRPEHTFVQAILVPIVRAAVDLGDQSAARALIHLDGVTPFELGFIAALVPLHLRGLVCLMLGQAQGAAEAFTKLLDHRGCDPFSPFHACAPLGLARASALTGDWAAARRAYRRFLDGLPDADTDLPALAQARREMAELGRNG